MLFRWVWSLRGFSSLQTSVILNYCSRAAANAQSCTNKRENRRRRNALSTISDRVLHDTLRSLLPSQMCNPTKSLNLSQAHPANFVCQDGSEISPLLWAGPLLTGWCWRDSKTLMSSTQRWIFIAVWLCILEWFLLLFWRGGCRHEIWFCYPKHLSVCVGFLVRLIWPQHW